MAISKKKSNEILDLVSSIVTDCRLDAHKNARAGKLTPALVDLELFKLEIKLHKKISDVLGIV